jgi:hypothetical protein
MSWLTVHWAPGRPEAPMQRWVLFECVPAFAVVPNAWLNGLLERLKRDPWSQAMHAWAMRYWLEHRALPTPFWVLQGPFGGHKYRYTNEESELAEFQGLPGDAPPIGALPYAELTPLTLSLIRLHSVLTDRRHATNAEERRARVSQLQRESRRLLMHQIDNSGLREYVADATPILSDTARRVERTTPGAVGDESAMTAKYIETGVIDATA